MVIVIFKKQHLVEILIPIRHLYVVHLKTKVAHKEWLECHVALFRLCIIWLKLCFLPDKPDA
jgi:hypothetical protein